MLMPQDPSKPLTEITATPLSSPQLLKSPQLTPDSVSSSLVSDTFRSPHTTNDYVPSLPSWRSDLNPPSNSTARSPQKLQTIVTTTDNGANDPLKNQMPPLAHTQRSTTRPISNSVHAPRGETQWPTQGLMTDTPRVIVSDHYLDEHGHYQENQQPQYSSQHLQDEKSEGQGRSYPIPADNGSNNIQYTHVYNLPDKSRRRYGCFKVFCVFIILCAIIFGVLAGTVWNHKDQSTNTNPTSTDPPNKAELCKTFGCLNQKTACDKACEPDTDYQTCKAPCNGDFFCEVKCQRANKCFTACQDQIFACMDMCM
ncbi:hypothetical protein BGX26_001053 [Mortierella sp. AD094]|nr:hypothetical protein BGX26_001053 [Mortierella sp. AD094]